MPDANLATAAVRRWVDALVAGDWTALAETIAEEHRLEDRRLGMKGVLDKAGNIKQAQVIRALGDLVVDVDFLETRGDRFALVRQTYRASEFEVTILGVCEVDDAGRVVAFINLDEDDLDAARATLDALGSAGATP